MKICFITFGCKVNICETEAMSECLAAAGYEIVTKQDKAEIFVVNSCTVTAESDSKLMQTLRRLKRDHPGTVTVLTGCFPQAFPERAAAVDFPADIVSGNTDRSSLPRLIEEYFGTIRTSPRLPLRRIIPHSPKEAFEEMPTAPCHASCLRQHTRAFLKIQDGCPGGCAYCIIPKARGNIRSKPIDNIIAESKKLAAQGYREIVLTGINLAFYGCGHCEPDGHNRKLRLIDAVEAVCETEGIERVRLGSLEPERITEEDISRLAALKNFCPCFHLSLQSGCGKTLAAMNRRYTPEMYSKLVNKLRSAFPDCGITTDIMTGFPGETEEDHRESMEFARKIGFSDIHVFPYSVREGTPAANMPQVPVDVKKRRAKEFSELAAACARKFRESLIGKSFPVLFEREGSDSIPHGYTPNYVHVKILTKNSEKSLRNSIFYVTIDKIGDDCCMGHLDPYGQLDRQFFPKAE
ncbi:MAG: tRNA (N(6)-L-threonylcarbamoyladenosine(37)-C(2))-methylthiotransferase MtaB [Oscillospiraceae bacterium]|nr:tRNA (N(6)-L-threonylcarbamoyladenosine(37)-C(2))-methylthiotransferase MtaB [Oscillospiraceae bacterium]